MAQNWVMMISELHRYQGVSYKSDIIVISGATTVLPTPCKLQIVLNIKQKILDTLDIGLVRCRS